MKRMREAETAASEIRSAIEELSLFGVNLKIGCTTVPAAAASVAAADTDTDIHTQTTNTTSTSAQHHVHIKPFLSLCNILIQILDKIGPTMAVLRQDIHQNIQSACKPHALLHSSLPKKRLEKFHDSDPSKYWDVVEILKKEVNEGKAKKGPTCSKAFVWLNRSLDFTRALLQLLVKDLGKNMEEAVEESYATTLKPWHGWISSAAYKVAIKLVPDSQTLVDILKVKDEDNVMLKEEMQNLVALLVPVLDQNNDILRMYQLDKLKST